MRIMFICHRFPYPPKRGGKIRPYNMIKHLATSHEVTVASIARSSKEKLEGVGLSQVCDKIIVETLSPSVAFKNMLFRFSAGQPLSMGYFYSKRLKQRINTELASRHYDLIIVHCSSVAQYVAGVHGIAKILDYGDMDSQKWLIYGEYKPFPLNVMYLLEGKRLEMAEKELASQFNLCTCTTRKELETLDSYQIPVMTGWFPNGVDYEFFKPVTDDYEKHTISFIGRMDYYPNQEGVIDFCRNVLPQVKMMCPDVRFTIVGADPPAKIRRLSIIPGVTVTGSVNDVRSYVQRSAVNVAPLNIARGTQNKVLEAMAMGVPAVVSVPAASGIDAESKQHLLVAENHKEFAENVTALLLDGELRQKYARAGRERMLSHHNWEKSMVRLDRLIASTFDT